LGRPTVHIPSALFFAFDLTPARDQHQRMAMRVRDLDDGVDAGLAHGTDAELGRVFLGERPLQKLETIYRLHSPLPENCAGGWSGSNGVKNRSMTWRQASATARSPPRACVT